MTSEDLNQYGAAYTDAFEFHDENVAMLGWYVQRVITSLRARDARSLLSLGIGHQVVSRSLVAEVGSVLSRYVIVEGSSEILSQFRKELEPPDDVELVNGWFEEYTSEEPFDTIEMGFVLEHVDDPKALVARYADMLADDGRLFIAVPNARSLHRQIGHHAGLLDDMYALSDADKQLGHKRYFDLQSLQTLVSDCGLEVLSATGIFLKPFTTGQLRSLELDPKVAAALYAVGADHPELCNALLVEAQKPSATTLTT